ncbi:MAG: hypothetical protein IT445_10365 [Phycisphaeraceae bacterium]|nr:hypothetical protein [Phycisphaeraceae bacterium]
MTSRDRMRAALSGQAVDRVPWFPCIAPDHAAVAMGHTFEEAIADPRMGMRWMLEVASFYRADATRVRIGPPRTWFTQKEVKYVGSLLTQIDRCTGNIDGTFDVQGGGSLVLTKPAKPIRTIEDIVDIMWPTAAELIEAGCLDAAREVTAEAHKRGLFVVGMAAGQTINSLVTWMGDSQAAMIAMIEQPDLVCQLFHMATDRSIEVMKAFARIGVDGLYIGDSYASSSVISPQLYADLCVPAYSRAVQAAHALDLLVYKHCCGNYNPLLEHLKELALEGIEGMDPTSGMTVARTREVLGNAVCCIGGVSCLTLLRAEPAQVHAEALACIDAGGRHGRYVLGSACAVPRATPVANMLAMAAAAIQSES